MLVSCLLALNWMTDPGFAVQTKNADPGLIATCSRPAAMLVGINSSCATSAGHISDTSAARLFLKRWESAARSRPDRSRSEREDFRRRIRERFNEHTLAAAEQIVDRIDADRMGELYEWRIVENGRQVVSLEAIPRDEVERLFVGRLRISLNPITGAPEQLVVVGRNQVQQTVWTEPSEHHVIKAVLYEEDVPPAPQSTVRTADFRIE